MTNLTPRPARSPLRLALIIGGVAAVCLVAACVGLVIFFERASNDPAVQARVSGTATARAASETAEAAQLALDLARLDNAELVFEETFDGPSVALPLDPAGLTGEGTYNAYYSFVGFQFAAWDEPLTDFVADLDCKIFGSYGACGIFFGGQPLDGGESYYHHAFYATGEGYGFQTVPPEGLSHSNARTSGAHNAGDWNHVRVVRLGQQVWYTLNDEEVQHLTLDEPALTGGAIGIIAGLLGGGENLDRGDVTIDNFTLQRIP